MDRTYSVDYLSNTRHATEVTTPVFSKLKDHLAQVKRGEVVSPVQYMMQSMENNEKQLNDHNAYFAETLEGLLSQQDLTKEQRRAMLMAINENKLVIDPEHLDPILKAYEKTNESLNIELNSSRRDLTALADTVNLLLGDNARLSEFLERKNTDLNSLLEAMSENEGELVQSLRANLNLLAEENRVLNYEISMLKDLRSKDRSNQHELEEKVLQDNKAYRKMLDDFSDSSLRNKSLEEQLNLLQLKVKNLNSEIEEERKRREEAEKKALLPLKNCPVCHGQGHQDTIVWQTKMNTIKEQERLQQQNLYCNLEKEELKAKISKLEELLRTKDLSIRDEHDKFTSLESEVAKLKSENSNFQDNILILKKKIAELIEHENGATPGRHGHGSEAQSLLMELDQENKRLKSMIIELQSTKSMTLEQYDRMNQDLIDQLRKETQSLKDEKRNLMAQIRVLMERRQAADINANAQQEVQVNIVHDQAHVENIGLRKLIEQIQAENRDLKRRLDENQQRPMQPGGFEEIQHDFPDHISEPTPRRTRGTIGRREREYSPIDDIVEKINQKEKVRGLTPEAIGTYLLEGEHYQSQPGIYRKKQNAMVANRNMVTARPVADYPGRVSPRDPFDTVSNDSRPRLTANMNRMSGEAMPRIDIGPAPRLMAQTNYQVPIYLNDRGDQVLVPDPSRPIPEQSVSSNFQTNLSQISQGFRADQPRDQAGLLSNFKLTGDVRRVD